jgi:hypothetical protein
LRAARQTDLGDERRCLAMRVIVVSIELGAGFDPRWCSGHRSSLDDRDL